MSTYQVTYELNFIKKKSVKLFLSLAGDSQKHIDTQTDTETHRHIDNHTDKHIDTHTKRHIDTHTDRHMDTHTDRQTGIAS